MEKTSGWYNERCHLGPPNGEQRWRCRGCKLLHFYCVRCGAFKTIPLEWEQTSVWTLNKWMEFLKQPEQQRQFKLKAVGWLCDRCRLGIREAIRVVPKPEPKIYVVGS